MDILEVNLTEGEFNKLNKDFPPSEKSSDIAKRAEELVKHYFRDNFPNCKFTTPKDGADLLVKWDGGGTIKIEIKGTADKSLAWNKLKVSSSNSHRLLEAGLPLYRIVSIYDRQPKIYSMLYAIDFVMVPEQRWSVRRTS